MGTLDNGVIAALEDFIFEYGYSKTIAYLKAIDEPDLAQFVLGLYFDFFYRPTL